MPGPPVPLNVVLVKGVGMMATDGNASILLMVQKSGEKTT